MRPAGTSWLAALLEVVGEGDEPLPEVVGEVDEDLEEDEDEVGVEVVPEPELEDELEELEELDDDDEEEPEEEEEAVKQLEPRMIGRIISRERRKAIRTSGVDREGRAGCVLTGAVTDLNAD